jgi:Rhomboid family
MLFLVVFGNNIEDRMRKLPYLVFYLASGYVAAYGFALAHPDSTTPLIGASGAISAADRLADHHHVRLEPPGPAAAAGAGREGMRLIGDQHRPVPSGELSDALKVTGLGQHDPDVVRAGSMSTAATSP